jgi:hypothetical protein
MAIQIESPETKIGARPGGLKASRVALVTWAIGRQWLRAASVATRGVNLDVIRHGSVPDRLWASARKTH